MGKQISEILEQMQEYMDISTTLATTSKKKYLKIIRLFLMRNGTTFSKKTINKFIADNNKNRNNYNYRAAFMHFLVSVGLKSWCDNITKVKKKPRAKVFRFMHIDKADKIIDAMRRYNNIAFMQLHTGVRFTEAITIRAENIDFDRHEKLIYIMIGANKSRAKGSKPRKIRLSKKYETFLQRCIKKPYGYVFLPQEFEYMDEDKLLRRLSSVHRRVNEELCIAAAKFGIDNLSTHNLRHIFADNFINAGGRIEELKEILGHARTDTTMDYVAIGSEKADEALVNMEGI